MAVQGMNGGAPSPLDRFQQVRDLARKKLEAESAPPGVDNRARLAELLRRKQAELGAGTGRDAGVAAAAARQVRKFEPPVPGDAPAAGAAGLGGLAAYGRAGAAEKPDPRPGLGRYIDLTA